MWSLLLFGLVGLVGAKNTFFILVPKAISPASVLKVGVNSVNTSTDLTVTATVQTLEWVNYPYYHFDRKYMNHVNGTASFIGGQSGFVEVQLPDDLSDKQYYLEVTVETSNGDKHVKKHNLVFYKKYLSTFIQTDKAIYKPGSTVNFRTFSFYSDLLAYTGNMTIEIFDPHNNRLKLMQNASHPTGVVTNSFKLSSMPIMGDWKIRVTVPRIPYEEVKFEVSNYKLPRFEVNIDMPSFALVTDYNIKGKVTATYTFGEPVKGVAEIHAIIPSHITSYCPSNQPSILMSFPLDGEGKFTIPMEEVQHLQQYLNGAELEVQAFVTETLTGKKLSGKTTIKFYTGAIKIEYLDHSAHNFKPGLTYRGTLKVSQQDQMPLPTPRKDVTIFPCVTYRTRIPNQSKYHSCSSGFEGTYGLPEQTVPVLADGLADIKLDIPSDAVQVTITAYYGEDVSTSWSVKKAYSPSDSFLQLELHDTNITAGDTAFIIVNSTEPMSTVWYEVISRGTFVASGTVDAGLQKTYNLTLPVTSQMAPHAHILVYIIRDDGEVVADSTDLDVQGLFANKVSLNFNKNESQPHENIDVIVKADPQSLVSLLVVDQSVTLLAKGNDITSSMVESELKGYDARGVGSTNQDETDASQVFQDASIFVFTDSTIPSKSGIDYGHVPAYPTTMPPIYPSMYPGMIVSRPPIPMTFPGATPYPGVPSAPPVTGVNTHQTGGGLKNVERVRKFFPETWLWTNTTTDASGSSTINAVVPDTVTSWIASAFAVNSVSGLGVTSSKSKLRVFRPFFVSLDVPVSVIRGEQVVIRASVYNYLQADLDVLVTMTKSNDFTNLVYDASTASLQALSADQMKTVHVPSNGALTVDFPIVPNNLGQLDVQVSARSAQAADAVQRNINVEAEGIRKETNIPVTIDLLSNNVFNKTITVSLPNNIVKDSQRARVRAFGDVLSPSLDGLDGLLKLPTGCGEQNMMNLAPDVYISNYLLNAQKFTGQIESKVVPFMEEGYQRELTYQHSDGSFSAWGEKDSTGSTWLTAFVVKTFVQARQYIFIDADVISTAGHWLLNQQDYAGYFHEYGHVLKSTMAGGSASGYSLTAYVLDTLLDLQGEKGMDAKRLNDSITRARAYLEFNIVKFDDAYTTAITTYVLTKAGSIFADDDFKKLEHSAKTKDGLMHWENNPYSRSAWWRPSHQSASAIDIETTAYALKTYALRGDYVTGLPIMKWLTSMRNPHGGYVSTQDTVVALDGLASFAAIIKSGAYKVSTDISSGTFTKHFEIDNTNAITLQATDVSQFTGKFDILATGHGIGYTEFAVFFNVEKPVEEQFFEITHEVELEALNMFTLRTCVSYTKDASMNMVVVEIKIPSGFEPDMETVGNIRDLKYTEQLGKTLVFYFEKLNHLVNCFRFTTRRTSMVAKLQASPIRAYDYYEPTHQAVSFYKPELLHDSTICDICADCCVKVTKTK